MTTVWAGARMGRSLSLQMPQSKWVVHSGACTQRPRCGAVAELCLQQLLQMIGWARDLGAAKCAHRQTDTFEPGSVQQFVVYRRGWPSVKYGRAAPTLRTGRVPDDLGIAHCPVTVPATLSYLLCIA